MLNRQSNVVNNDNLINTAEERLILNKIYYLYILFAIFALMGTISQVFTLLNIFLCVYLFFRYDNKTIIPFIVYATFFASILKLPVITDMSMMTVIILLYSLINIWKNNIDSKYLIIFLAFLIFTVFMQLISDAFMLSRNIKFYNTFLYTYFAVSAMDYSEKNKSVFNYKHLLISFILGVIVSSLMRFLDGDLFNISQYVYEKTDTLGIGDIVYTRFSGLYSDPNYYAINVILAMCVTLFLYAKKDIKLLTTVALLAVMVMFIVFTRGKSGFLMLFFPLIIAFYISVKQKDRIMQAVLLLGFIVVVALVIAGKITIFNSVIARFQKDKSLSDATTNRTDIWLMYLQYFVDHPNKLLFGSGISTGFLNGVAAHNTYLDILYHLGLLAGICYVWLIVMLFNINKPKFKRNLLNVSGILAVCIMYFFISSLFDIDVISNIIVCATMLNVQNNMGRK